MEYKDTLLMPKTRFEMRGKLPTKEPNFQKRWKESEIYETVRAVKRLFCMTGHRMRTGISIWDMP